MKVIKLDDGKEVTLRFNERANKLIRTKFPKFNPFENNDWMDDMDLIEYAGYEAAKQGARYHDEKFNYSFDKFGSLVTGPVAIEIIQELTRVFVTFANYLMDNTPKEKKQEAGAE